MSKSTGRYYYLRRRRQVIHLVILFSFLPDFGTASVGLRDSFLSSGKDHLPTFHVVPIVDD